MGGWGAHRQAGREANMIGLCLALLQGMAHASRWRAAGPAPRPHRRQVVLLHRQQVVLDQRQLPRAPHDVHHPRVVDTRLHHLGTKWGGQQRLAGCSQVGRGAEGTHTQRLAQQLWWCTYAASASSHPLAAKWPRSVSPLDPGTGPAHLEQVVEEVGVLLQVEGDALVQRVGSLDLDRDVLELRGEAGGWGAVGLKGSTGVLNRVNPGLAPGTCWSHALGSTEDDMQAERRLATGKKELAQLADTAGCCTENGASWRGPARPPARAPRPAASA